MIISELVKVSSLLLLSQLISLSARYLLHEWEINFVDKQNIGFAYKRDIGFLATIGRKG